MVMTAHLRGVTLPTDADVDVEIKIHTRLNISAYYYNEDSLSLGHQCEATLAM